MHNDDARKLICPFVENGECVGDNCMAWAFLKPSESMKDIYVPTRVKTEHGYCSLVGYVRDE